MHLFSPARHSSQRSTYGHRPHWSRWALITAAINARHLLLGATLHRYIAPAPPLARLTALSFLSDANWASTSGAIEKGERDLGHLLGGGLILWGSWLVGTGAGLAIGAGLGETERLGVDVLMPAFFALSLMGLAPEWRRAPPWLAAAPIAAFLALFVPPYWAVLIGAAGGAAFGVWHERN